MKMVGAFVTNVRIPKRRKIAFSLQDISISLEETFSTLIFYESARCSHNPKVSFFKINWLSRSESVYVPTFPSKVLLYNNIMLKSGISITHENVLAIRFRHSYPGIKPGLPFVLISIYIN
jgi:hypothetical protein